jgi:hypothetical protein
MEALWISVLSSFRVMVCLGGAEMVAATPCTINSLYLHSQVDKFDSYNVLPYLANLKKYQIFRANLVHRFYKRWCCALAGWVRA